MSIGIMFLPMTVYYFVIAIEKWREGESPKEKWLIAIFTPIFAVPAIALMTIGYIGFVAYIFLRRCVHPDFDNESGAEKLKLFEAVGEANLQAVLG